MEALVAAVIPFLAQLLVVVFGALIVLARTKVNVWLEQKIGNEKHEAAAKKLNDMLWDLVLATEQTVIKSAKEHLADGRITKDEYRMMLSNARAGVVAQAHEKALPQLKAMGIEAAHEQAELLQVKLEAAVAKYKLSGRADSIVTGVPQLPKL